MRDVIISAAIAIAIVVLLILIFDAQIHYVVMAIRTAIASMFISGGDVNSIQDVEPSIERFNDPKNTTTYTAPVANSTLDALGYTADAPWDAVLQATELDPSTFVNHMDFVKDVRRFSSGANFTSVTDDNTNLVFVNFVGLRRPSHVPIGSTARQIPDVDESVLQRNREFRY